MQNRFSLLNTDVMCMFMIIAIDIVITMRFSINCSAVICSPTVIFAILREATSETYGPESLSHYIESLFHIIKSLLHLTNFRSTILQSFTFRSINQKYQKKITLPFIYLYQISLLHVTVKGLTTPLARWVQTVDCSCRYSVTCALSPTGLIPWFSKLREILTLL